MKKTGLAKLICFQCFVKNIVMGQTCAAVHSFSFTEIPTDSGLRFYYYAGWVKNDGHGPNFPFIYI